jgi:hypothetical protein
MGSRDESVAPGLAASDVRCNDHPVLYEMLILFRCSVSSQEEPMRSPAFPAASSASPQKGWQRLAVLAAGAITAAGAMVSIATPATAVLTGSASAASLSGFSTSSQASDPLHYCEGPYGGSGGRSCEEPTVTPLQATRANTQNPCGGGNLGSGCPEPDVTLARAVTTIQDCDRGPLVGSGGRACEEPTVASARAASVTVQACGGGFSGSGGRSCDESDEAPAGTTSSAAQVWDDGGGVKGGGDLHSAEPADATIAA